MDRTRPAARAALLVGLSLSVLTEAGSKNLGEPLTAPAETDQGTAMKVEAELSQMTLDEKIGHMAQVDRGYLEKESDIRDFGLGSILSGGGSAPPGNSPAGWVDMVDRFQSYALQTRRS